MSDKYILDKNHKVVEVEDLLEWGKWIETADRVVAKTLIGDAKVSTVFLGLDPSYGEGLPLLFETVIFGGKLDGKIGRYTTWQEAKTGHEQWVEKIRLEFE